MPSRSAVLCVTLLAAAAPVALAAPPTTLPTDLGSYRHINTLVVPDPDSPITGIHHFYMTEKGRELFRSREKVIAYPTGTVILGKVYKPVRTPEGRYVEGALAGYTMMVKRPQDVGTRKTGGWYFAMFDGEGRPKDIDPVSDCFGCHQPHGDTDYVLSDPLR